MLVIGRDEFDGTLPENSGRHCTLFHQAQIAAGQGGRDAEIGVAVHAGQAVLDPPRGGAGDTGTRSPVVRLSRPHSRLIGAAEVGDVTPIAVHIGRKQGDHGGSRRCFCIPPMKCMEGLGLDPFGAREDVLAGGLGIHHRMVWICMALTPARRRWAWP